MCPDGSGQWMVSFCACILVYCAKSSGVSVRSACCQFARVSSACCQVAIMSISAVLLIILGAAVSAILLVCAPLFGCGALFLGCPPPRWGSDDFCGWVLRESLLSGLVPIVGCGSCCVELLSVGCVWRG